MNLMTIALCRVSKCETTCVVVPTVNTRSNWWDPIAWLRVGHNAVGAFPLLIKLSCTLCSTNSFFILELYYLCLIFSMISDAITT